MKNSSWKKVIILGATGFFGRYLLRAFEQEKVDVQGFGSSDLNLLNADALKRLDPLVGPETCLVTSAALTPEHGDTLNTLEINFQISLHTARYVETHPTGLFVHISSDAVYPMTYNPITENTPTDADNFYALSKLASEKIFERIAAKQKIPYLNLRLSNLYGPGDTHNSYGPNRFINTLRAENTIRLFGNGEEKRDHVHVEDAARITRELIAARAVGTYNIATGNSVSFAEIVEILQRQASKPFEKVCLPRKSAVTHRDFDVSKLFLSMPGFRFRSVAEGLTL